MMIALWQTTKRRKKTTQRRIKYTKWKKIYTPYIKLKIKQPNKIYNN